MPTDAVQNARAVIAAIGVCRSVKALGNGSYEKVLGIVQRHPNATVKLKGVVEDFFVKKNGSGFILWMKKKGCEPERISYRKCDGKTSSMINTFRNRDTTNICAHCRENFTKENGCEVDHKTHFATIVEEFVSKEVSFKVPTETQKRNDKIHGHRLIDLDMEKRFQDYHESRADLQLLCKKCNRSRGGPPKQAGLTCTAYKDGLNPKKRKATSMA
ncbi:hypothetical protein T484DRAFT_1758370 [Baffinella frigidus]|nr:hypothetical protein T484DRAFT_1758370 [Cryptophyta sp. CCMP2293]